MAAPSATPLVINNSQGRGEELRWEQRKGGIWPKAHKPHAVLRARKTTKEKHRSSKIDLGESWGYRSRLGLVQDEAL